ncbi:MAG: hypothetical protein H8D26_08280 [Methanomicrobia archaeon]|nr:hypothetical protein [Methanomicrobia archaeon]
MKEFGNDNGVVYVSRSEDALMKVVELIESGDIESKGKKAMGFVENNDWEKITDEFEKIL